MFKRKCISIVIFMFLLINHDHSDISFGVEFDITNSLSKEKLFNLQWGLYNDGLCKDVNTNSLKGTTSFVKGIDINIKDAWKTIHKSDSTVIVALIDTGVDYSHFELSNRMWINNNEIADDGIDNDKNGFIDDIYGWNFCDSSNKILSGKYIEENNHGTHCAGIIAAEYNSEGIIGVTGVANVKIMSLKVLQGTNMQGKIEDVISAIQYAEKMGAKVCNMSFSLNVDNKDFRKTIKDSTMLFVVSAGNNTKWGLNIDKYPVYPASYNFDNVISVANLQFDGVLNKESNYGTKSVDIAAPGTCIFSTICNNKFSYETGSSMATPFVTGVSALLFSQFDNINATQIKEIICNSSKKLKYLKGKVKTEGILDASNAIYYEQKIFQNNS